MKREKFLWPLTQGHQRGLMAAKNIRGRIEAMDEGTRTREMGILRREILEFWESELQPHFQAEEELLRVFSGHVGAGDQDVARLLDDHRVLEKWAHGGSPEDLSMFSDLLVKHIRFEEETVFGRIERALSEGEIRAEETLLREAIPACGKIPDRKSSA